MPLEIREKSDFFLYRKAWRFKYIRFFLEYFLRVRWSVFLRLFKPRLYRFTLLCYVLVPYAFSCFYGDYYNIHDHYHCRYYFVCIYYHFYFSLMLEDSSNAYEYVLNGDTSFLFWKIQKLFIFLRTWVL